MSDACTYGSYHTLHSLSRIQSYPAHTPTDMRSSVVVVGVVEVVVLPIIIIIILVLLPPQEEKGRNIKKIKGHPPSLSSTGLVKGVSKSISENDPRVGT